MRWMLADTELFPPVETALTPKALVRRIMATLVPGQLQLVTRNEASEAKAQRWPRQYRADDINLSLHLSRDGNGDTILLGLITSADEEACIEAFEGTKVALYYEPAHDLSHNDGATADVHSEEHLNIAAEIGAHEEGLLQSTQVDDLGNIIFKGVPVGAYHMIVYLPENELVIEGLDIHQG